MLEINLEYRKGILFIRLKGQLIKSNASNLNEYVMSIIQPNGIKYIVYNFCLLDSFDIKGLEVLRESHNITRINKGEMFLCGCMNKLDKEFKTIDNELQAFDLVRV